MNGGGPLATPLRALRHEPRLVDDVGVLPRLAAAAAALASKTPGVEGEELVRWTRAWLIVWQGVLQARGVIGTVPPWTVSVPLADVPTLKGDPDRRRRAAAIDLLERAGYLLVGSDRGVASLAESAFVPHRAGLELDWSALGRAVRYEPAPLLAARALADLVVPAGEPTAVALRELAERTGYAPKQVRVAVRRLIDTDLVRVSETSGAATRYWFDAAAGMTGRIEADARALTRSPSPVTAPVSAPVPVTAPLSSPAPATQRKVAVRMTLNGVTFGIGPGLTPHVELGPDGIPHVTFDVPPGDG